MTKDEAWNISHCYLLLDKPKETAVILSHLINGDTDDFLMACQISTDIQDEENQNFSENLIRDFTGCATSTEAASSRKEQIVSILSGKFHETRSFKFLNQNNRSNKDIVAKVRQFWDGKNSVYHNGIHNLYAIMHAGTSDDTYLTDPNNKAWVTKNSHWARFLAAGCLGTVHKNNPKLEEVISKYYPSPQQSDDYVGGGALFALGLGHASKPERLPFLLDILRTSQKEPIVHGACLGIGLLGMSSYNLELVEELKPLLYDDSAIKGEAAAYSIGLIMAGNMDQGLVQELLDTCRNNTHEKIIRGLSVSLALMAYQSEELADLLIAELLDSKDHIVRYGGAYAIGMAYVGTGNTGALKKLLSIAASDVSDDVRRAAVVNIGFVMLNQPEKVPKIINLLINSYNSQVRFGAALAIGISCAGSNLKEALTSLERLQQDSAHYVRQGVSIAMAMVMQQATKNHNPIVEEFRDKLLENIKKKNEDPIYKFGAMLSLGLLDAGGRNCVVTLSSQSGKAKKGAILGMVMFTQYWYWFPFVQMISLSLEPTMLMGLNKDLKIPKGFTVKCNTKKSVFDYPPIKKIEDSSKELNKAVVELSTTRRAKAKHGIQEKAKQGEKEKMIEEKAPAKMDIEKEETKEPEVEEAPTTILSNPSRVLKKQMNYIEYMNDNRYQPITKDRKRGYIFLRDTTEDIIDEYVDDEPLQAWLIPPPDFIFNPSLQHN